MIAALEKADALRRHAPSDRSQTAITLTDAEASELIVYLQQCSREPVPELDANDPWPFLERFTLHGFSIERQVIH